MRERDVSQEEEDILSIMEIAHVDGDVADEVMRRVGALCDRLDTALNAPVKRATHETPAGPQHVCGLQGFGALGDVCPACSPENGLAAHLTTGE